MSKPISEWTLGELRDWQRRHNVDLKIERIGNTWVVDVIEIQPTIRHQANDFGLAIKLAIRDWEHMKERKKDTENGTA